MQKEIQKNARRHFARVGGSMFIFLVLTMLLQILLSALISRVYPAFTQKAWLYFAVQYLPYYLLAVPYSAILLRLNTFGVPPKEKLRFWELISFLPICLALSYLGNWIGNMINTVISLVSGKMPENALEGVLGGTDLVTTLVFVVVLAPIFEELVFRKLLIDALYPYGEKVCIVLSALLFGAFHGNFYQFFYAAMVGGLFAFVYCRTGKVRYTVILHALFNFIGGVVAQAVMGLVDVRALMEGNVAALLMDNPLGTLAFLGYSMLLLSVAVLGFILLIRKLRKTRLKGGEIALSHPVRTAILSVGVLLFLAACVVLFILGM